MSRQFCEQCGQPLAAGTKFCEQCGAPVPGPVEAAPAAQIVPPSSTLPAGGRSVRVDRSRWRFLAAGAAALLVLAVGVAGFFQRDRLLALFKEHLPKPAAESQAPVPTPSKDSVTAAKDKTAAPAAGTPAKAPVDDSELDSWFSRLPWVGQLQISMPRGVTLSISAEPPEADGWASVDVRENHAPDSGFDPNVSPMVGNFRVSKDRKVIEWMEPVSGDYKPLADFLKKRKLQDSAGAGTMPATTEKTSTAQPGALSLVGGDFEGAPVKGDSAPVIAPDPLAPANHVAKIVGPDDMSFQLPVQGTLKAGAVTVSLRVFVPPDIRLQKWEDGRTPEGIRLRVRLNNPIGNSVIRDTVLRPTGAWRLIEMDFADPPREVKSVSVEAIWMEGAVYVDDVRIAPAP